MTVGSLFAGIEGFGLGFEQAGFEVIWQVEKEPFCIAVLKTRFPNVERYYEIRDCGHGRQHKLRAVDVVTAGFPCQDLSVAGKRAGLAGTRSGLFWEVIRIVGELRPTWLVLENVPGLFSSNNGRDFAVVLRELGKLGCFRSIAWAVLDSQYFRVAQRRRRVFIVCGARIGSAEQVLFEPESGEGDFTESGETRPELALDVAASLRGVGGTPRGFNLDAEQGLACYAPDIVQQASIGQGWNTNYAVASLSGMGSGGPDDNDGQARRIVECKAIDSHGVRDFAALTEGMDSARYRALGNAVTVSVAQWIAERIKAVSSHDSL